MSRREKTIVIPSGRDEGKTFVIREMDAFSCESWGREVVSAVYRFALEDQTGVLNMIADSIREAFQKPIIPEIKPPEGMDQDHPVIKQAQVEAEAEAIQEGEKKREATPTQLVAILGLNLLFRLPTEEQDRVLKPLLDCASYRKNGADLPIDQAEIQDISTIAMLRSEAFKLHTDFFMIAVPSIYQRIKVAGTALFQQSMSPAQ